MKSDRSESRLGVLLAFSCLFLATAPFTDATAVSTLEPIKAFGVPAPGANPRAELIQGTDGALYGTAEHGGYGIAGTVFKLNPDGTGLTVLWNFTNPTDGGSPTAGLIQGTDGALYGTASTGGSFGPGYGTVFTMNTDGTGFTVLKSFGLATYYTSGAYLFDGLIQGTDGALYGVAYRGGSSDAGTVFKLNPDGTGFTVLKTLVPSATGANPFGSLIQGTDGALYGTASYGGSSNAGTLFKLNTDGTGFAVIKHFSSLGGGGYRPYGELVQGTDGALYGATGLGGSSGGGTVFKVNTDGTGFTVLVNLSSSTTGSVPIGQLIQGADGALYGTANQGGSSSVGTVFKVNTDGTGFTVLQNFNSSTTGAYPNGGLLQGTDGTLYGMANQGGSAGYGTVFKVNTDGTDFTVLENLYFSPDLSQGGFLYGGMLQGTDSALYGMTNAGGMFEAGTVFKVNTDGTGFTILQNLDGSTVGGTPYGGLIQGTDGALYGMTSQGGTSIGGTVFRLNPDGTGFTVLVNLDYSTTGGYAYGGLVQGTDGALYGTAASGGSGGGGTVFKLNPDGTGFTVLQNLDDSTTGGIPVAGLMQGADGALYGTTYQGGSDGYGTVFKLNPDGTGFTVLENFDSSATGGGPYGGVIQGTDGALYGTTSTGGSGGAGTVFRLALGQCDGQSDGAACDDDDPCTQTDTCQAGVCTGSNPVVCTPSDSCHDAGTCSPSTGLCSNPVKADGSSCSDGDACTQTDACQAGICVGSDPVTCAASDQCHDAGTCNPTTGLCSDPAKPDGSSCSDGSACTQTDTCQAGTCTGSNYSWSGVLQPVNADGTSVFKLGSTIPTKFKLTGACAENPNLIAHIYFYQLTTTEGPVNEASSTANADTGTVFRYSASDDQYIYNLSTKGLTQGTWNLGIDLHDGMGIRTVTVGLRK